MSGSVTESFAPGRVILVNESAGGARSRPDEMVSVDGAPILQMKEGAVNLSRGKIARQSSTFGQGYAAYGVDGIIASSQSAW